MSITDCGFSHGILIEIMQQNEFLYKKLADDIEGKILGGELKRGEKLPSLRQMHKKLGCSLSTVYQAYMEVEAAGLVESRPKSGFIVTAGRAGSKEPPSHGEQIFKPGPVRLRSITSDVVKASLDPNLIPLGASVLAPELLPYKHLNRITRELMGGDGMIPLPYAPPEGIDELRRYLSGRFTGLLPDLFSDDLFITNGCMEAVTLSLSVLVKEGDVVAVESPTHFGFLHLLKKLGAHVVGIPMDAQFGVLPESLDLILRKYPVKACLLAPNFHNPTGSLIPEENRKEIVRLTNSYDIPVIEDDVYGELFFGNKRPALLKAFDKKDLIITCSSVSKVLAAGYRIGWCMPGKRFKEELVQQKAAYSLCSPSLQQHILCQFFQGGGYDRYLRSLRTRLKRQVTDTVFGVKQYFPQSTKLTMPKGGNMLWIELPRQVDGVRLYHRALEQGVSIVPGHAFAISEGFEHFIRVSATSPFDQRIEQGLKTLGELVFHLMDS